MKKILFSIFILAVLALAGIPGKGTLRAAASPQEASADRPVDTIQTSSGLVFTVDGQRAPKQGVGAVHVSAPKGPAVALLQTVPAVPGVTFELAGQQYVTGMDGTVAVMVPQPGSYTLQVITDTYRDPYRRVEFARWLSETYEPTRQIHLPSNDVVQVGLNVYELVGQKFIDLQGKPVAPGRVKQFSIRSVQGDAFTFRDGRPRWIPASRVTRRRTGGLQEVPLLYTVTDVTVDGSNVVNKAQQQFYAQPNAVWSISLLFYSLRIDTGDAIFGFPQGKQVELQLPDRSIQTYPLDPSGSVQLHSLARGNYTFRVLGAKGFSTPAPIALSKDQEIDTKVISFLDLEVVGAAGALVALSLFLFGRLSYRRSQRRNSHAPDRRVLGT